MERNTRIHPVTGKTLTRGARFWTITEDGEDTLLEIKGWYPDDDSDSIHTGEDMKVYDSYISGTYREP